MASSLMALQPAITEGTSISTFLCNVNTGVTPALSTQIFDETEVLLNHCRNSTTYHTYLLVNDSFIMFLHYIQ